MAFIANSLEKPFWEAHAPRMLQSRKPGRCLDVENPPKIPGKLRHSQSMLVYLRVMIRWSIGIHHQDRMGMGISQNFLDWRGNKDMRAIFNLQWPWFQKSHWQSTMAINISTGFGLSINGDSPNSWMVDDGTNPMITWMIYWSTMEFIFDTMVSVPWCKGLGV